MSAPNLPPEASALERIEHLQQKDLHDVGQGSA